MELYVNCTVLQTLHLAVADNVAKLIILSFRISKIKLAHDLKAAISFSIFFIASLYQCAWYGIDGHQVTEAAGQIPLKPS